MMTVRFPNGTSVQYNSANFVTLGTANDRGFHLYTDDTKRIWIASIQESAGAIVEGVAACRVYNPVREKSLSEIVDGILTGKATGYVDCVALARLKAGLRSFDAGRKRWK